MYVRNFAYLCQSGGDDAEITRRAETSRWVVEVRGGMNIPKEDDLRINDTQYAQRHCRHVWSFVDGFSGFNSLEVDQRTHNVLTKTDSEPFKYLQYYAN